MSTLTVVELTFPPEPITVGRARRAVRQALTESGAAHLIDNAQLVVSELVTNAVMHAGTPVMLRITAEADAVRVEIEDSNRHMPTRREWTNTAGTGRGLTIVDELADRWSARPTEGGKVVWFEIGRPSAPSRIDCDLHAPAPLTVGVTLLRVPLLMHWAWQEHACALLREYLLYSLEQNPDALDEHARASDALSLLLEHVPKPQLPAASGELMASLVEPGVTADEVTLHVPTSSVEHFALLEDLIIRAIQAARRGKLLGPATQPEIAEMRAWLCGEVARQAHGAEPRPWVPQTDVRVPFVVDALRARVHSELVGSPVPLIATDDTSVIVAVTPDLVEFLGYPDETALLGRRILVVIPTRFHQAHIAGATLNATNGRDVLLNHWVTVPVLRADGSEVLVELRVEPRRVHDHLRVFVAEFRLES